MPLEHISDTARWVAIYRAMESERPDALFRDPFARRLAGDKGEQIVNSMKQGRSAAWSMIVRTTVMDEIIMARVRDGADLVVNLAAGLDARPWRLPLPATLRWADIDLPEILQYKTDTLRGQAPACAYEAIETDLTDAAARSAVFARLGATARNALIVTEGLLIYLSEAQVTALAGDLLAQPAFRWWLIDIASPRLLVYMNRWWGKEATRARAPFQFAAADSAAFFGALGWRETEFHSMVEEAHRLRREMRLMWLWRLLGRLSSARRQDEFRRMSGIVLLEHA